MNDLKFRVYTYRPERGYFMEYSGDNLAGFFREYEDDDIAQFTGLKDKNGVDVYEGDIVEFDAKEWYRTAHRHGFTGIPEHGPREAVTMEMLIDGNYFGSLSDFRNYKTVIGNIYQHSHLLDGE